MTPLAAGARLGLYEILSLLGAGGMGEVYRARDPRLGREVAVKVLPRAWVGDPERQQRFEAEARAAGAINHPNIVTLHDVGVAGGSPYLVTEILDGETLRATIERGRSTPERAAPIVIQTAQGLAAAHAKGIVHRDLKPENLQLLPDGRIKILDFGIAKLTRTDSTPHAETTPVFASMTATGTIMGTVSYMSPEQLRDRPVDHRADLFALGAIFYELLTGTQAFPGETAADRVSAILSAEPVPLAAEIEQAMPGLQAVIGRLLAKRPDARFDSAGDLAFTLELLAKRPAQRASAQGSAAEIAPGLPPVRFRPLTFRDGIVPTARFAPDGQTVVYQAIFDGKPSEILLSRIETPEARALGLRGADLQAVSRTAEIAVTLRTRDIGGFVRLGTLARLPMIGGTPRELAEDVFMADWSPNGKDLAAIRKVGATYQLEAPLGNVIHSTNRWISHPRYSPDGSLISFFDHPAAGNNGYVCVIRPGEPPRRLTTRQIPTLWRSAWRRDGREVWYGATGTEDGDGVFGVDLEGHVRHVFSFPGFAGVDDINEEGEALFIPVRPRMQMETSTRSAGVGGVVDLSWLDWSLVRDINVQGTMALFDETGVGGGAAGGVFIRSLNGEPAIRLSDGGCSSFSEDGRFVLVGDYEKQEVLTIVPTGVGTIRELPIGGLRVTYADWIRGSNALVLVAFEPGEPMRLHHMDLDSGAIRRLHDSVLGGYYASVSPDGRHILARGADGILTIFPTDGAPEQPFPGLDSEYRPAGWFGDSRSFFVLHSTLIPAPVYRVDAATGTRELWMSMEPSHRGGVEGVNGARFTRDGERYVCSYTRSDSVLYHAQGLR